MNLTIKHCYDYLRSLHPHDVCGVRRHPTKTFIARVARHASGCLYAYLGGDLLQDVEANYYQLSPQVARVAQAFDTCNANDFGAYDVAENGLTAGYYMELSCGAWFQCYCARDRLRTYSPAVYRRYYAKPRKAMPKSLLTD